MKYKSAVVVLIGAETAERPRVCYEIGYALDNYKPLVGIHINGLADRNGRTDPQGSNPFQRVTLEGGGTVADHVQLFTPTGSTCQERHANIRANIKSWAEGARGRRRS